MRYSAKTTIVIAILAATFLELYLLWPKSYMGIFIAMIIVLAMSTWFVIVDSIISRRYLYYLSTPILFVAGIFAFLSLNESQIFQHLVVAISALLIYLYYESVYLFNFDFKNYHDHSIENVSGYMNFITMFLVSVSLYAANSLLALPFWLLLLTLAGVLLIIFSQSFWAAQISTFRAYIYEGVLMFLILQFFWAIAFLPTNFYAHGFLLTIVFYAFWGLSKASLLDILSASTIKRYVIMSALGSLLIILTTSWI